MATSFFFALTALLVISAASGATWTEETLQDPNVKYTCAGGNVTLNWTFTLAPGEHVSTIVWLVHGPTDDVIAVFTGGVFTPFPTYLNRVSFVSNAGIALTGLGMSNMGNYSAELTGADATGQEFKMSHSAIIQVISGFADSLMTLDGQMHAFVSPTPVYRPDSGQWHLALTCGTFKYRTKPTFDVQWVTPSGAVLPSTDYQDGQFVLALPNPVEGGRYTCALTAASAHGACLHPGTGGSGGTPGVDVDGTQARLTLLEAGMTALVAENKQLKERGGSGRDISFHAVQPVQEEFPELSPVILNTTISNRGNAYDPTTGYFTVPVNGTYFFIGSTETSDALHFASFKLMADDEVLDLVSVYQVGLAHVSGLVHGVTHLVQGQKVFLSTRGNSKLWDKSTAFSGFLISADSGGPSSLGSS